MVSYIFIININSEKCIIFFCIEINRQLIKTFINDVFYKNLCGNLESYNATNISDNFPSKLSYSNGKITKFVKGNNQ